MAVQNIITQVGSPFIRSRAKRVRGTSDVAVQSLIDNLIHSMHFHELVGMAAPQIGSNLRVFVSEIRPTKLRKGQGKQNIDGLRVFINPEIIFKSRKLAAGYEGCGSVANAGLFARVKRPASIIVKAYDRQGKPFTLKANHLLARVIQHECDHLNGVVFTDKADLTSFMSRSEYLRKFQK